MPLITLRGARMAKSLFGLVRVNNRLHSFTRCCRVTANEGKASDSLLFRHAFSAYSYLSSLMFSSTQQQPCSLTDSSSPKSGRLFHTGANSIGFNSGNFIVRVSGLSLLTFSSLLTMPLREKKTARRLFLNQWDRFSSSRYSLASIGLKGDQNLICE